ncbi:MULTISPECIES: YitT family protein [Vibrio]|uniref:YitT family protein n=1 Tax=Vibrio TaxID=662 RepID=UPI000C1708B5|nr:MULTISPECIES: YitT family protein [Vibrio]NAW69987.1 YitT family protein [Vibrio sp. V28_P6S34P95]NAX05472.1 YitT family protein [Vibrio sp. V30_P3S12P165]NAX34988.1 YitT family protein [Vibrio sp. V29_P1S30P107]NAX37789.1 YitT family protein [Vibrio sp. V27_P1S3P104]NAX40278.1 YitT family protein [Vibrio sp. V26_P1S5P106]
MEKHTHKEDIIAMLTGTFLVAQGVFFLQAGELLTGGTAGLALLLTHLLPWSFGVLYFIANSPFYLLAWRRFGRRFALNSVICGALVSLFADHLSLFISLNTVNPFYCALAGGLLMGLGMLILFRHRASLGGFNVLCLYIQDRYAISVGKTQMAIDGIILASSLLLVSPITILLSIFGALILNIVLAMNHKPTRYKVTYQP